MYIVIIKKEKAANLPPPLFRKQTTTTTQQQQQQQQTYDIHYEISDGVDFKVLYFEGFGMILTRQGTLL